MTTGTEDTTLKLSWKDIKDLLFILPLIHVTFCFIFLEFYSLGFGSSIDAFFSPSDILHVSFKNIALGYLSLVFILPTACFIGLRVKNSRPASDKSAKTLPFTWQAMSLVFIHSLTLAMMLGLSVLFGIIFYRLTRDISVSSLVGGTIALVYAFLLGIYLRDTSKAFPVYLSLVSLPFAAAAFSGAITAEMESTETYETAKPHSATCGDFVIIRVVGDHYLAISRKNDWFLVDSQCDARFYLRHR
jgi:hypothetical protein